MFKSKVLSSKDYEALSTKAKNYDKIVAAVLESNSELKPEDVTFETIQELMKSDSEEADPELQQKLQTLQKDYESIVSERDDLITERDDLQTQVNNLLGTPPEDPAGITSDSEVTGKAETLLDFANKNKGETAAIIQAAVKDGFLPQ